MAKVTQGHIDCLVNWMKRNPGKSLNVSGTWRNNGYEVHNGHQTMARNKAYKVLEEQGYEIDKIKGAVISRRVLPKNFDKKLDGTPKEAVPEAKAKPEEKPETSITIEPPKKPKEMKAKAKIKADTHDDLITIKPDEVLKTETAILLNGDGTVKNAFMQSVKTKRPTQFDYTIDLTPDIIQPITESLQGMMHTARLMGQKAQVKISIEMGE